MAGEPGPSVARRFDVGLANLRKKASREGWTRAGVATRLDPAARGGDGAGLAQAVDRLAGAEDPEERPVAIEAAVVRAAQRAAWLISEGRAAEAQALIRAAQSLADLTGLDPDAPGPLGRMRAIMRM